MDACCTVRDDRETAEPVTAVEAAAPRRRRWREFGARGLLAGLLLAALALWIGMVL